MNFIYDKGVTAQMVSFETYIDTYVVHSTFYLTIIIAIFVFRDANCKSSIKLSLLSLLDIFVSHYQISDSPDDPACNVHYTALQTDGTGTLHITPNWGVSIAPHNDNDDDPRPHPQCCHQ